MRLSEDGPKMGRNVEEPERIDYREYFLISSEDLPDSSKIHAQNMYNMLEQFGEEVTREPLHTPIASVLKLVNQVNEAFRAYQIDEEQARLAMKDAEQRLLYILDNYTSGEKTEEKSFLEKAIPYLLVGGLGYLLLRR